MKYENSHIKYKSHLKEIIPMIYHVIKINQKTQNQNIDMKYP